MSSCEVFQAFCWQRKTEQRQEIIRLSHKAATVGNVNNLVLVSSSEQCWVLLKQVVSLENVLKIVLFQFVSRWAAYLGTLNTTQNYTVPPWRKTSAMCNHSFSCSQEILALEVSSVASNAHLTGSFPRMDFVLRGWLINKQKAAWQILHSHK